MKYLIDTHTLLWIVTKDKRLSKKVKDIYLNPDNQIFISLASLWEMAIKINLNKLSINEPLKDFIKNQVKRNDINILDIKTKHILLLESLPYYHKDPFDRLIISQSITELIPLLSFDKVFDRYSIKRIW